MTDLAAEVASPAVTVGAVDFVLVHLGHLPVLHFESLDAATVSWCRDWVGE